MAKQFHAYCNFVLQFQNNITHLAQVSCKLEMHFNAMHLARSIGPAEECVTFIASSPATSISRWPSVHCAWSQLPATYGMSVTAKPTSITYCARQATTTYKYTRRAVCRSPYTFLAHAHNTRIPCCWQRCRRGRPCLQGTRRCQCSCWSRAWPPQSANTKRAVK